MIVHKKNMAAQNCAKPYVIPQLFELCFQETRLLRELEKITLKVWIFTSIK